MANYSGDSHESVSLIVLLDTIYGAVMCGSTFNPSENLSFHSITTEELNKRFERLWQLELMPRDDSESNLTMDERAAVESMETNLVFLKDKGRFETRLLWRGKPDLKNNYAQAKVRLDGLMRRVRKDPEIKEAYVSDGRFYHRRYGRGSRLRKPYPSS